MKHKASKKVKKIWPDMGYRGKQLRDLMKMKGKDLEILQRPRRWFWVTQEQIERGAVPFVPSFTVLPRRWVVERTFARIGRYRKMSKDYEYKIQTSKVMLFLCLARTFLKHLCKAC